MEGSELQLRDCGKDPNAAFNEHTPRPQQGKYGGEPGKCSNKGEGKDKREARELIEKWMEPAASPVLEMEERSSTRGV